MASSVFSSDDDRPALPLAEVRQWLQKLKSEREGLSEERTRAAVFVQETLAAESTDNAKLQARLDRLMKSMTTAHAVSTPHQPAAPPDPKKNELDLPPIPRVFTPAPPQAEPLLKESPPSALEVTRAVAPLALAQALFRDGNYQGALKAYRVLPLDGLKAEERVPVQYMIATCLRKLGKVDEATVLYREVANSRGDEQLAACAQWQLSALRGHKESVERLTQLRQRRLALEQQP